MHIRVEIKILLRVVLCAIISILLLSRFNLFTYISLIPQDQQYNVGLTVYLAITESIFEILVLWYNGNSAKITCVFFVKNDDIELGNTPSIVCANSSANYASIKCRITLNGSAKVLLKSKLALTLPKWLSSQVSKESSIVHYTDNTLLWSFDTLIPNAKQKDISIQETITLPFIQNDDSGLLVNLLTPELKVPLYIMPFIKYTANKFKITNKEDTL